MSQRWERGKGTASPSSGPVSEGYPITQNLFGTDGIRDLAGQGLLTEDSLDRLGVALARHLRRGRAGGPRVLLARDTRISGPKIERTLVGALAREGCDVERGGVLPTPAVSLLVAEQGFSLGIMISASHNPAPFNGIKIFDRWGRKLEVDAEEAITADYLRLRRTEGSSGSRHAIPADGTRRFQAPESGGDYARDYQRALLSSFPTGPFLAGIEIAVDCARGATARVAEATFRSAGATVDAFFTELDGARINDGCGSLDPQVLQEVVRQGRYDLGVAFDGDGDRALLVDEGGKLVDGDDMLALWALELYDEHKLSGNRVVSTVMANAGLERFLRGKGIAFVRTPVGDREVFRALGREGAVLGGEQSGHLIYSCESATGDGIRTALHLARLIKKSEKTLSQLCAPLPRDPQVLLAVRVGEKVPFEELPAIVDACDEAQAALDGRGRVFLRYSGTEPVARVLVEGPHPEENERWAGRIAELLRRHTRQPEV